MWKVHCSFIAMVLFLLNIIKIKLILIKANDILNLNEPQKQHMDIGRSLSDGLQKSY